MVCPYYPHYPRRYGFVVLVTLGAVCASSLKAYAQETPPPSTATADTVKKAAVAAPPPRQPYFNLQSALAVTQWDAQTRGPLIVVDPQSVQPWTPKRNPYEDNEDWQPPVPLPPKETGTYPAGEVAAHFGRKVVRLGSCAVMAPTEMVLLNPNPGPPDPYAGMRREQKLTMLQATLTASQWQALTSAQGLGLGDMDKDQRPLFLSYLPDPIKLRKATMMGGGGYRFEGTSMDSAITLSDTQRAGVRLRLNRQMQLTMSGTMGGRASRMNVSVSGRKNGESVLYMTSGNEWGKPDAFGVRVVDTVPNKLKASQIDFDAPGLTVLVSVSNAKTIGDLIKRIREATGAELYADGRIAKLPVWVRAGDGDNAGNVRAGELLKGLCWCVTGAVRRIEAKRESRALPTGGGVAFVLTDDIDGVGARKARLAEWYQNGSYASQRIIEQMNERIRKKSPLNYVQFAENDPLAPSADLQKRIEESWKKGRTRYEGVPLPLRDLPAAQQAQVRETANQYASQEWTQRQNIKLDMERVNATVQGKLTMVIPGVGETEDQNVAYNALQSMLPPPDYTDYVSPNTPKPTTDPIALTAKVASGSVLYVAPRTPEEAASAVTTAKRRGVRNLWLPAPEGAKDETGAALVAAAVAAGAKAGVGVWPVLRALSVPGPANAEGGIGDEAMTTPTPAAKPEVAATTEPDPEDIRDRNILGETQTDYVRRITVNNLEPFPGYTRRFIGQRDFLRPDVTATLQAARERALNASRLPGIAGVVFSDTAAAGYTDATASGNTGDGGLTEFGYTPELRLAYLRKEGYDPVDLGGGNSYLGGVQLNLPFFPDVNASYIEMPGGGYGPDPKSGTPLKRWAKLRYDLNASLLADLYKAVRAEAPALPLLIRERGGGSYWASWEQGDKLPLYVNQYTEGVAQPSVFQSAKSAAKTALLNVSFNPVPFTYPGQPVDLVKPDSPQAFSRNISTYQGYMKGSWSGIVFDLTAVAVPKALGLFEAGIAPPGTPVAAPVRKAPPPGAAAVRAGKP